MSRFRNWKGACAHCNLLHYLHVMLTQKSIISSQCGVRCKYAFIFPFLHVNLFTVANRFCAFPHPKNSNCPFSSKSVLNSCGDISAAGRTVYFLLSGYPAVFLRLLRRITAAATMPTAMITAAATIHHGKACVEFTVTTTVSVA